MRKFNGYNEAKILTEQKKLPAGGYIVKILDAKEEHYDWGDKLAIRFDIAEGEYRGFYKEQYDSQQQEDKKWKGTLRLTIPTDDGSERDNFLKRVFKSAMTAIEESNAGFTFDWDESKLKNLMVGALFGNNEYEFSGKHGFYTACRNFISVEKIKNGEFKIPADKLLDGKSSEVMKDIPDGMAPLDDDEDIPF